MGLFLAEVTPPDFSAITGGLTGAITPTMIVSIIGVGVAACAGFVLAWIGARKLIAMIQSAIARGKLRA